MYSLILIIYSPVQRDAHVTYHAITPTQHVCNHSVMYVYRVLAYNNPVIVRLAHYPLKNMVLKLPFVYSLSYLYVSTVCSSQFSYVQHTTYACLWTVTLYLLTFFDVHTIFGMTYVVAVCSREILIRGRICISSVPGI